MRLALGQAGLRAGTGEDIREEKANVARDPSDDELVPHVPNATLVTHPSFPVLDPPWNTENGGKMEGARLNPSTPKSYGGLSDGPAQKASRLAAPRRVTWRIAHLRLITLLGRGYGGAAVTVAQGRLNRTGQKPDRGWPGARSQMDGPGPWAPSSRQKIIGTWIRTMAG